MRAGRQARPHSYPGRFHNGGSTKLAALTNCLFSSRLRMRRDERGASLIEYGLLVALIAIVCVVAITFVGSATANSFSSAGSLVTSP